MPQVSQDKSWLLEKKRWRLRCTSTQPLSLKVPVTVAGSGKMRPSGSVTYSPTCEGHLYPLHLYHASGIETPRNPCLRGPNPVSRPTQVPCPGPSSRGATLSLVCASWRDQASEPSTGYRQSVWTECGPECWGGHLEHRVEIGRKVGWVGCRLGSG
jgi:hypothetical protein